MKLLIACFALVAVCAEGTYAPASYYHAPASYYHAPAGYYHAPAPYYVPQAAVYAKPIHIGGTEYRSQDTLGQYSFGYSSDNGIQKSESRGADGSVAGRFGYTSPEGQKVDISYTAGEEGFQASGPVLPKPVQPTADVVKATQEHERLTEEMKAKIAAAPKWVEPIPIAYTHQIPYAPYAYPRPLYYHYHPTPAVRYTKVVSQPNSGFSYSIKQ